jgi:thioesterase domain-containing protein
LERICRSEGVTLYALTLSAFNVLLQRYCGTDDIAVTTPVANRKRPETQRLLGVIVNTIVLRNDLSGDPTFRELLGRVHAATIEAFEHEELPFGHVVDAVQPDHDEKRFPLSQVMFNYLQRTSSQRITRRQELEFGEEHLDSEPVNTRSDLVLHLVERGPGLRGLLNYDGALFDPETIQRMAENFLTLLEEVAADPDRPISQLPMVIEQQQQVERVPSEHPAEAEVAKPAGERVEPQSRGRKKAVEPTAASPRQTKSGEAAGVRERSHRALVPLHAGGHGTPLFLIHGMGGHVAALLPLAKELSAERTVFGVQGRGLEPGQQPHDRVEPMAAVYLEQIRRACPRGPYLLAGWSMGGLIAWEAARQLAAAGQEVPLVVMIDTFYSESNDHRDVAELTDAAVLPWIAPQLNIPLAEIQQLPPDEQWAQVEQRAQRDAGIDPEDLRRLADVCKAHVAAFSHYVPQAYDGRAVLLRAKQNRRKKNKNWKSIGPRLSMERVPGDHYTILREPHVDELARRLKQHLDDALPAAPKTTT